MAQRRMFSKDITEHDSFLEMPLSTQALYFHLGMQADDDGFVSPNRIMRMIGCHSDDLKILVTKKFVLCFDDGIIVIKHWKMNNYLRPDRYKKTKHADKMALLKEKDNGAYSWYTTGIPTDIPLVAAGKVRIGKVNIPETDVSDNQKDMSFKNLRRYKEDGHWEEKAIDLDSGEEIADELEAEKVEERELNAKIRHNLKLVEEARGLPFGKGRDMNYHVKIYRELLKNGWSHEALFDTLLELINSDHWQAQRKVGQYPGMNTVQFTLRNKKPS